MTPEPQDVGMFTKIIGGLSAAVSALGIWAWGHTHKRIDEKADSLTVKNLTDARNGQIATITDEIKMQRSNIAKLFDKGADLDNKTVERFTHMEERNSQRHIDLINAINSRK